MECPKCQASMSSGTRVCSGCGHVLLAWGGYTGLPQVDDAPPPLASLGQRFGSALIDLSVWIGIGVILGLASGSEEPGEGLLAVLVLTFGVLSIGTLVGFRRGQTIGLYLVGARIVRTDGTVSGFFHTYVRSDVAVLSALPLGLGFWWALWDKDRQTWHDKIMGTRVVRDSRTLADTSGTSAGWAVGVFWPLAVLGAVLNLAL